MMRSDESPILELKELNKCYDASDHGSVQALSNVNLQLYPGECLGVVGESGSGKSTLARCITHLEKVTSGQMFYRGQDMTQLKGEPLRQLYKQVQMVFQEPSSIFNPRVSIGKFVREPLLNYKMMRRPEAKQAALRLLERVGVPAAAADKYPHELSGGELQRVVIARAIGVQPDIIVFDEATSALDAPIQQQILDLLVQLRRETGVSCIFISHDLAVVQQVSDRVVVMNKGEIVEVLESTKLTTAAQHPYTRSLMESVLSVRDIRNELAGRREAISV